MNKRILKWSLLLSVIATFLFVIQFTTAVKIIYLISGEPSFIAENKAVHANILISSNIKNISIYLKDFLKKPEFREHQINSRFFGLNVAPSSFPDGDDHIIKNLFDMGVQSVRVDYGYGSDKVHIERFLNKLIDNKMDILLHLVQSKEHAGRMSEKDVQDEWRKFLEDIMSRFSPRIKNYEIGAVPNRKKWSGYTIPDYITALKIASEAANKYQANIFAPNIQDFEPFWQVAIFEAIKDEGINIQGSTDNLFVDRAIQPEFYDEHVLGSYFKNSAKMDLINKSRFLDSVSEKYGIKTFISSFTQWNLDVSAPFYNSSPERRVSADEYADYLVRYYVLLAAGGYTDRVYWGHYASYKEGIFDDSYNPEKEDAPEVHHKFIYQGDPRIYKTRPAYNAYKTMTGFLSNSNFTKNLSDIYHLSPPDEDRDKEGVFIFEFEKDNQKIYVGWTLNVYKKKINIFDKNKCSATWRDGETIHIRDDGIDLRKSPTYIVCN
jgi:hypothetical protein